MLMDYQNNVAFGSSSSFKISSTYSHLLPSKNAIANGVPINHAKHSNTIFTTGGRTHNGTSTFLHHNKEVVNSNGKDKTFEDYKKKVTIILEEYFMNDDVPCTSSELLDLGMPNYHHYFVKKLLSMAMDRRDKEKEMAAFLLSSLYAQIIHPQQLYQGFSNLLESGDDLAMDIPDLVEVLAIFIARAVVDDILPPTFLSTQMESLQEGSKGKEILIRAKRGYLSTPYQGQILECKWGTSKSKTAENVRERISNLLREYVVSGDRKQASMCIKDLHIPFFHHEIVKQAISMAMEKPRVEVRMLDLLKMCEEEGLINSSQMTKGFSRLIDNIDDLRLDVPNARDALQSLISKAASSGWLHASSLKPLGKASNIDVTSMKWNAQCIVEEYLLSGDVLEVCGSLESLGHPSSELNAIFVKRLINLAMDRRKREKEMASMLLSSLCLPADDVISGFVMLIESAEDTALDNPIVVEDVAMFLARTVVDEVMAPSHLNEIESYCWGSSSIVPKARSLLNGHLAAERILRCWGGGGNGVIGWRIEDVKDEIQKLVEEYEGGGGFKEAYRCIKEVSMPFFHHEIVKRVLVAEMERRNERLWGFLEECFESGLITTNQMTKGFGRVVESLDDLVLDVPDARIKFVDYVDRAKARGWLDPSFSID